MKRIAHIISTIFQPLLMPTYNVLLLYVYTYFNMIYSHQFWYIVLPVFIFSFALPALLILLLHRIGIVSDLSLTVRKERIFPYLITLVSYCIMIFLYYKMRMPQWFILLMTASAMIMVLAIFITLKWKISAHMLGAGGLTGGVMGVSYFVEHTNPFILFILLFLMSGCVATSRLILRRHTLSQVVAGFLLGLLLSFTFVRLGTVS